MKLFLFTLLALFIGKETQIEELKKLANKLAQEIIIIDTHIDLPEQLLENWKDISNRTTKGDFDYSRAKAGGLKVAFMSVFVSSRFENNGAKVEADSIIDIVEKMARTYPDKFAIAKSVSDIHKNFKAGKISLPMGIENGAPIEGDLNNLKYFYNRGIRYITLTHSRVNHISDSSFDTERKWNGLSLFGKQLVQEMNRIGMIIDVSHVSDSAFYQVIDLSKAPVVATHSSCRYFTPGLERNMSDDMIKALAKNGGVIQINFGSSFLRQDIRDKGDKGRLEINKYLADNKIERNSNEAYLYSEKYWQQNPIGYADVTDVVDHIEHVIKLVGVDYVGLGSDFNGLGDSLPTGLKDVSNYPNIIFELLKRGYSQEEIKKICGGNFLRVWSQVEKVAASVK